MGPHIEDDDGFTSVMREAEPANIVIKVESFSSLSYNNGVFESRSFLAGCFEWKFIIYPDGLLGEEENEHIPVFLSISGEELLPRHWMVNAAFSFFLYNHKLNNYLCIRGEPWCFHSNSRTCGFSSLISKKIFTDPCSGYLADDSCVFGAEVSIIRRPFMSKTQDPCNRDWLISRFSKLGDAWTSEIFSIGSRQWRVKLYPKGNGCEKGPTVSIYLESITCRSFGPGDELKAEFSISLNTQYFAMPNRSVKCSHRFTCCDHEKGLANFMSIADLHNSSSGFLVADNCYIGVTMFN